MTARVIDDPSALGWEYDSDTGRWTWGGSSGGGGGSFPEAPIDGEQYARQNAAWSVVDHPDGGAGGGNVTTSDVQLTSPTTFVPSGLTTQEDANNYIGEELEKIIPDAPANGTIYGRQNNGWVSVPSGGGGSGGNDPRITDTQISNWDTSFGWGNHATQGYLTSVVLDGYATESWVGVNFQAKGNYLTSKDLNGYATQTWTQTYVSDNYQRKGTYLTSETDPTVPAHVKQISTADIANWNSAGGGGGDDPNAVKLTGDQTVMGVKKFLGGQTIFQNLFIEGLPAGGVGFTAKERIEFAEGEATTIYGPNSKTLQVNIGGTSIVGELACSGKIESKGNVGGTSFTSTVNNAELLTVYGNAVANNGAKGAGLYFSKGDATPTITPCLGSDYGRVDNTVSLGNPSNRFTKVWAVNGAGAVNRHTQNENEAVLSVNDLIDVLASLREATKEEKTVDGLRDSIGNCVGGIIEKLEAIQAETEEQLAQELAEFESNTNGEI